jgi:hypothetical protein
MNMKKYEGSDWNKIETKEDLKLLPMNKCTNDHSLPVLVGADNKRISLPDVYLMYYDFIDCLFHFPNYSTLWKDIPLKPIEEIIMWTKLPEKPLF